MSMSLAVLMCRQLCSSRRWASSRRSVVVVIVVVVVVVAIIVVIIVFVIVIIDVIVVVLLVVIIVVVIVVVVVVSLCRLCCPVIIAVVVVIIIAFGWLLYLPLPCICHRRHLCPSPLPPPNAVVSLFFVASPLPTPLSSHCHLSCRASPALAGCFIADMSAINDTTRHMKHEKKNIKSCYVGDMLAVSGTTYRHVFKINLLKTSKMSTFPAKLRLWFL
jgi:hypothetical protein